MVTLHEAGKVWEEEEGGIVKYWETLRKSWLIVLIGSNASIFIKIRNIWKIVQLFHNCMGNSWVTILVLLPITNYLNIPKELYITMVTPWRGWIEQSTRVCLSHWHLLLETHWSGDPLSWLCFWRHGLESEDLLVQFTLVL